MLKVFTGKFIGAIIFGGGFPIFIAALLNSRIDVNT
jgi:hypothetical protein